jgi:hypothetical protein
MSPKPFKEKQQTALEKVAEMKKMVAQANKDIEKIKKMAWKATTNKKPNEK